MTRFTDIIRSISRRSLTGTAALLLALALTVRAGDQDPVLEWLGQDTLHVRLHIAAGVEGLPSTHRVLTLPAIVPQDADGADRSLRLTLDTVEFAGRRNRKYHDRAAVLHGTPRRGHLYSPADTLLVDTLIQAQPWMRHTTLSLCMTRIMDGCCSTDTLQDECLAQARYTPGEEAVPRVTTPVPPHSEAERLAQKDPLLQPATDYRPFDPDAPLLNYPGAAYIRFAQDEWDIDAGLADNAEALRRLSDILTRVEQDSASRIVKILIVGTASPDGPLQKNIRLAGRRAESLKQYIEARFDTTGMDIELANAGEGWGNLTALLRHRTTDDLPHRADLLRIIERTPNRDQCEHLLRTFKDGQPFQRLLELFDVQRTASAVRLYYEAQADTAATLINDAMRLIQQGSYRMAVDMLEPLDDDRRYNALGTAYYMTGRREEARACFEKAAARGDAEAQDNLKQLTRSNRELKKEE